MQIKAVLRTQAVVSMNGMPVPDLEENRGGRGFAFKLTSQLTVKRSQSQLQRAAAFDRKTTTLASKGDGGRGGKGGRVVEK